jgi:hypothetical protein
VVIALTTVAFHQEAAVQAIRFGIAHPGHSRLCPNIKITSLWDECDPENITHFSDALVDISRGSISDRESIISAIEEVSKPQSPTFPFLLMPVERPLNPKFSLLMLMTF